jgi:hypothetical protein
LQKKPSKTEAATLAPQSSLNKLRTENRQLTTGFLLWRLL